MSRGLNRSLALSAAQEGLHGVDEEISDKQAELAALDPPSAMKPSPLPSLREPVSITDAVWSGDFAAVAAALQAAPESISATYPASGGGMSLTHAAVQQGHTDVLRLLLESGAPPDTPKDDGATALLLSAAKGSVESLQLLLSARANPRFALPDGTSVLHVAAGAGQSDILHALIAADDGLDLDTPDGSGNTPLGAACAAGQNDAAQFLLGEPPPQITPAVSQPNPLVCLAAPKPLSYRFLRACEAFSLTVPSRVRVSLTGSVCRLVPQRSARRWRAPTPPVPRVSLPQPAPATHAPSRYAPIPVPNFPPNFVTVGLILGVPCYEWRRC